MSVKFSVDLSVTENGRNKPEYTIDSDLNGQVTLQDFLNFTKQALIITADQVLKEEQSRGFDKEPILLIDGKKGKSPLSVNPLGEIEFVARQSFGTVLIDSYECLLKRSIVLKGTYIASHFVTYNGVQVATDLGSLQRWLTTSPPFKNGDTIRIVNIQPYARRLELLGVTAQRQQTSRRDLGKKKGSKKPLGTIIKVPNGAYQLTYRSIKAKYKQNVKIRFNFLPGSSVGLKGNFKSGRRGKNSAGRPYLYPTLVFDIDERGIL